LTKEVTQCQTTGRNFNRKISRSFLP